MAQAASPASSLSHQIGQKLMLDLRYYCENESLNTPCRTPLRALPGELADAIARYQIGGVILFTENLDNSAQIVRLTRELQKAAAGAEHPTPLFISIDQEGGRVARLPRDSATSFTGNMSIGATYPLHGTRYAAMSASVIADELKVLGINVNYAPTIDVNMNPANPVINVRSFGEDPAMVAMLGAAQVKAFQEGGVIAALKHFPGHGDTDVDSHTGLPVVHHDKETVWHQDLLPFREIIRDQQPGMIMTAHIQYPALDDSTLAGKDGSRIIKPATMSRKIMTDLLRGELGYTGVTITDALDMAGISHFFDPVEAVIGTFSAGVDIALMPLAIRGKEDISKLGELIADVTEAVKDKRLDRDEIDASAKRIAALKNRYLAGAMSDEPVAAQTKKATQVLGAPAHRKVEAALAESSITEVKNLRGTLPLSLSRGQQIAVIMPDTRKCVAMEQALKKFSALDLTIHCISLQGFESGAAGRAIADADLVIAGNATPAQSAVEIGGMDDLQEIRRHALSASAQPDALQGLLESARSLNKKVIFLSLRAPYDIARFGPYADAVLASYAYNVDVDGPDEVSGPAFSALTRILLGQRRAEGHLPVTVLGVNDENKKGSR